MTYDPRTTEILVNEAVAGNQTDPSVTRLADGNILVVWATPTNAANNQFYIAGQLFDPAGNKIGTPIFLTDITLTLQHQPDVIALPNGGFAVSWTAFVGGDTQVKVQLYDSSGTSTTAEIGLDFGFTTNDSDTAALADSSVVVVWNDGDGADNSVSGAIVASNGTVQNFTVETSAGVQSDPSVAALAGGNFVVTWADTSGVGGDADGGIKARIFSAAGTPVGAELLVNTSVAGVQNAPTIAALPSGGFVIVWGDGSGGHGQVFDAAGTKVGAEFALPSAGDIVARTDGGFIVTWTGTDVSGSGVYGQQVAADGTLIGAAFPINTETDGSQTDPALAIFANDDIFVAWEDSSGAGGDNDGSGIKARIFTSIIFGDETDNQFVGTSGNDDFQGLGGNDTFLLQQGGDDEALGGEGNDLFYFGDAFTPADRVDGGFGTDTLVLQGVYANLALTPTSLTDVEQIVLWTGSNTTYGRGTGPTRYRITTVDETVAAGAMLTVNARQLASNEPLIFDGSAETDGRFFVYGGAGNDNFTGGAGSDSFDGGAGTDTMAGGGGNDVYFVDHPADVVLESAGEGGFDAVYARANYVLRTGSHVELLAANGLTPGVGITLYGNEQVQSVVGGSGNDALFGLGGDDFVKGNDGNDQLDGGTGLDVMTGGAGNDVYYVDHAGDLVHEAVGGGFDQVYARVDYALRPSTEVEKLATTGLAPGQAVVLRGNEFGQSVIGGSGDDSLFGEGGNDFLTGNGGNDLLDGGAGLDALTGGAGNDIFRFSSVADSSAASADSIYDFTKGSDLVDLHTIDADSGADGDQAFIFIGSGPFTNQAGQLRVEVIDGVAHILGDVNGDGVADLRILAYNLADAFAATDFVL